jgi:hypothetical protein
VRGASLVLADQRAGLGVTNVLQVPPPLLETDALETTDGARERHHGEREMKESGKVKSATPQRSCRILPAPRSQRSQTRSLRLIRVCPTRMALTWIQHDA